MRVGAGIRVWGTCLKAEAGRFGVVDALIDLEGVADTCKLICGRGGVGGRAMNLAPNPDIGSSSSSSSSTSIFALRMSLAGVGGPAVIGRFCTTFLTGVEGAAESGVSRCCACLTPPTPSTFIRFRSSPSFSLPLRFNPAPPIFCTFIMLPKTLLVGLPDPLAMFKEPLFPDLDKCPILLFSGSSADDSRLIDRVVRASGIRVFADCSSGLASSL